MERLAASERIDVDAVSSIFRFPAVGQSAGAEFCNAAAACETDLPPLELLDLLQSIELEFGRKRSIRWGPRTLDLDLIVHGNQTIDHPRLRVPHPACWYRRFVLDPLVEIAGDMMHPEKNVSFAKLRERLMPRPMPVALIGGDEHQHGSIVASLQRDYPEVTFLRGIPDTNSIDPAIVVCLGGPEFSPNELPRHLAERHLNAVTGVNDPSQFLREVLESALAR
jgi:2-amino-4-hydroxy-6-hydroxymethyldihydropteridine diphosphokinase